MVEGIPSPVTHGLPKDLEAVPKTPPRSEDAALEPLASIGAKADYVRSQPQTRNHTCHWPGCTKQVPPAMWGCLNHWKLLPPVLRIKIWRAFRPGQEIELNPSQEYIQVAKEVQEWAKLRKARSAPERFADGSQSIPPPSNPPQGEKT